LFSRRIFEREIIIILNSGYLIVNSIFYRSRYGGLLMDMGRVRGTLVLNITLPTLIGKKLRIVEEVDPRDVSKPGELFISFDYIGAGEGQLVLYEGGPESAMAFLPAMTGSDANILAIVDDIVM
jgi:microcompartment protein CcmK/EutM